MQGAAWPCRKQYFLPASSASPSDTLQPTIPIAGQLPESDNGICLLVGPRTTKKAEAGRLAPYVCRANREDHVVLSVVPRGASRSARPRGAGDCHASPHITFSFPSVFRGPYPSHVLPCAGMSLLLRRFRVRPRTGGQSAPQCSPVPSDAATGDQVGRIEGPGESRGFRSQSRCARPRPGPVRDSASHRPNMGSASKGGCPSR